MQINRIFDILNNYKEKFYFKDDVLAAKENKIWHKYSAKEYIENSNNLSLGLIKYGIKKGDRIITLSNNRPEWNFLDMAMLQIGAIHVPIYPTLSNDDLKYIINHCEPTLAFVSDKTLYEKINNITREFPFIKDIFTFNQIEGAKNWKTLLENHEKYDETLLQELEERKNSIKPDDIATIIYTSGTTGNPKGVMLSHKNILSNVDSISKVFDFNYTHRTLSFLPLSHVFERTINYYMQSVGLSIYYAENIGTIAENLKEVKPHLFITVPRVLEKMFDRIIEKGKELKGIKKLLFFWSISIAKRYKFPNKNPFYYEIIRKIFDKIIYSKWREAVGGNVEIIVSGGAALQPRLATIFNAAGIPVIEGYGMTEASPVISVNRMPQTGEVRIGTVGPAIPGVEVKIADDGEILVKGDNVMVGYYKEPELTSQTIDNEGWLHTGDVGTFVDGKFIKITDRKKEIFKLSSGKYIAPQAIENKLKESIFIEQAIVVGENQKFASAIICPNFEYLHNWCTHHNIYYRDNNELITKPEIIAQYQKEIININKQLGKTEQIKRFRLICDEWSPATGELSPTLKLKRKFIINKYKDLIEEIYSKTDSEE